MIVPPPLRAVASYHRAAVEAAFGPLRPDPDARMPPGKFLFLCFTNRCGSNYLAHLLATTGAFNEAGEFFNAETVLEHSRPRGLRSLGAYFATLYHLLPHERHIAAKAGVDQLAMLADAGILDALGPRAQFVLMERQDRLGQAVSRVIAMQTGRFTTAQAANVPDDDLVYSRAAIAGELEKIALANALFYAFFAANGIAPVHTTYEDVLGAPAPVMARIAAAMGDDALMARPEQVQISRQANAVNQQWRLRYLAGA
ncbi:hypothetical protein GCM10010909_35650 [Acidocella aquatica]|uniref:Sulphotransferase Stf0 domain-containing protein n=1 Tax=Acidocella aquatica TaxID=1922313 RepID=A0ABQ6AF84_9PROT|nr:Stf0 family sulfotransferase [Acidocella aquatica]GLR68883.1 hypothetical protein GCM10010909_35650 [Acidocella aquatica]